MLQVDTDTVFLQRRSTKEYAPIIDIPFACTFILTQNFIVYNYKTIMRSVRKYMILNFLKLEKPRESQSCDFPGFNIQQGHKESNPRDLVFGTNWYP